MPGAEEPPVIPHPWRAGALQRCPRCGKGALFKGILSVVDSCAVCGLNLSGQESADGPAFFVITFVGFLSVAVGAWMEASFQPEWWVHIVTQLLLVVGASLFGLRLSKGILIAYQFKHKTPGFEDENPP